MIAQVRHILPLTTIRRERALPVPGKVLVRKGQKVGTTDSIAEAKVNPEHLLLDVARGLKLSEEKADQAIQCKPGEKVADGDVLAGPVGLTKRVIRAPKNGKVILTGGGQILLEIENQPYELKAAIPGTVVELLDGRGAIVEGTGALIQGVWGNGRIDYGLMHVLLSSPDDVITPDRLDVSLRGSIVLAGYCNNIEVLKTASELPLRGLIFASIDIAIVSTAARLRIPVLVIEGFGKLPMNSAAYKLLTTNDQREVTVNAEQWHPFSGSRPEVFIALPAPGELPQPPETVDFAEGQQVHIVRAPYTGKIGTIVEVRPGTTILTNGLATQAALVHVEGSESALIPLANLEVLV
jgi:hypothetical protein